VPVTYELPALADVERRRQGFPLCGDLCPERKTFAEMQIFQEREMREELEKKVEFGIKLIQAGAANRLTQNKRWNNISALNYESI